MCCVLSHFSHVWLSVTLWTVACKALLSMGFSRQEHWSGLPCPPLGNLPDPGIEPASLRSLALAGGFFMTSTTWEAPTGIILQTFSLLFTAELLKRVSLVTSWFPVFSAPCLLASMSPRGLCLCAQGLGLSRLLVTLWTVARQFVDSPRFCPWNFPGKDTGVGGHCLLQGNLPSPGIPPASPVASAPQADSLQLSPTTDAA